MNKETTQLYSIYKTLPNAEQQILQVLSVIFEPLRQGIFQEILRSLEWRDNRGTLLSQLMIKSLREKFLRQSLLTYEKGLLQCNFKIIELLTAETVKNKTSETIVQVVRKKLPFSKNSYSAYGTYRPWYKQALLRLALHWSDEKRVLDLLRITDISTWVAVEDESGEPDESSMDAFTKVSQRFYETDKKLFDNLPAGIRYIALSEPAKNAFHQLQTGDWPLRVMEDSFPKISEQYSGAACLLAELRIYQGRLAEAETLLAGIKTYPSLSLGAWINLLQGKTDQSLSLYEEALRHYKKVKKKRVAALPGLSGIFHIFALLADGETQDLQKASRQIKIAKKSALNHYTGILHEIMEMLDIYQGKENFKDMLFLSGNRFYNSPVVQMLHSLLLLWIGEKPASNDIPDLIKDHNKALKVKFNWMAWQIEQILLLLDEKKSSATIRQGLDKSKSLDFDIYDFTRLIKIRESWEIVLDALDQVSSPHPDPAEDSQQMRETGFRMTWRISEHGYWIEPREQKLGKNGKWTKGRPVALKKLYSERENYEYLSEQDQQICNQIKEHNYYESGYLRTDYLIDHNAMLAAIGHPLVFMENNLNTPVELVKSEPSLMVKETAGGKSLKLTLEPYSDEQLTIKKEADQKLSIIAFTPQHQKIAEILGPKGATIPRKAKSQVMERIAGLAPLLTIHSDIAATDTNIETVSAQQTLHFHLQPVDDGLTLSAYIKPFKTPQPLFHPGEGGATVLAEVEHKQVQTRRDLTAEKQTLDQVLQHCPALYQNSQYEWHLDDPETALETLLQLQELSSDQDQVQLEWPQGKKITLNHANQLSQMQINVRKSRDWFTVTGELHLNDDRVMEMRDLMNLLTQTSGRFVRLGDHQFLALTDELRKRLEAMRAYTSDNGQFHALAVPAMDELCEGMKVKASKPWKDQLTRLQQVREFTPKLPSTLQAQLRDYQLEGFQWLSRLAFWGAGACLADDMGLGKTLQALALILTRCKQGPTLVLAPTSVCSNWETEAFRFSPTLKVKRFGAGDRQKLLDEAGAFELIICSYGLLQSESKRLSKVKWHTIVADEAQAIKNPLAKRSKAAMQLQAEFRLITTGTPIENHLGELWSLFNFINPGLLGSLDQFNKRYASPIEKENNHSVRSQLKNLISPFILRRLKTDVLTELPPRTEITHKVTLSKEERALYEAMRQQAVEKIAATENPGQQRMQVLAEIMRLRRVCCNPRLVMPETAIASAKLDAFAEILEDLRANQHHALVFSQFVGHLALIREYLDKQKIEYQYLDGSTPIKKRQQAVDNFQAGEGELFLISLKAGGSGLNLTAADYVIHLDPWWNPAVEDQASDRAHRIGQQRPVTVYRLVAENTIEEKIVSLHAQKRDLADSLLEGTEMSGKLSVDEILDLLSLENAV